MLFFKFLGQFTLRRIIFQEGVGNFEIEHKTCYFLAMGGKYPFNIIKSLKHKLHETILNGQDFIRVSRRKLTLAWRVHIAALDLMLRIWNGAKCLSNSKFAYISQMFIQIKHLANTYKISLSKIL